MYCLHCLASSPHFPPKSPVTRAFLPLSTLQIFTFLHKNGICYIIIHLRKKDTFIDFSLQADSGLPSGWEVRHSNSKNLPYYFNPATKESRWEPPADTDTEKLKNYMATHHTPAARPDAGGQAEGKIRCSHLLVKHNGSRRPSSWREADITRSKEEAIEILKGYEERINAGESLGDIAVSESDCSSARKKGDLYVWIKDSKDYELWFSDFTNYLSQRIFRSRRNAERIRGCGLCLATWSG